MYKWLEKWLAGVGPALERYNTQFALWLQRGDDRIGRSRFYRMMSKRPKI